MSLKLKNYPVLTLLIMAGFLSPLFSIGEQENSPLSSPQDNLVETVIITDMAGREVEVPRRVERIFCKGPMGTILMYTLSPDKLVGWNFEFTPSERAYIPEKYLELPVLGGWFGNKSSVIMERLLKVNPDLIIDMELINDTLIDSDDILQEQLGIPVVIVDGEGLDNLAGVYRFLGSLLGEEERAEELASYCSQTLSEVTEKSLALKPEERVSVYYALGSKGLRTEPEGSRATELISLAGGINAAGHLNNVNAGVDVSLEQVLLWNPQVIVTAPESSNRSSFFQTVYDNRDWQEIDGVKNQRVYGIPQNPFGWFDRPPSANRVIGIKWMAQMLYPALYDYDMVRETKRFYKLFYHYVLSDDEVSRLMAGD